MDKDYWLKHKEAGLRMVEVAEENLKRLNESMGQIAIDQVVYSQEQIPDIGGGDI